MKKLTLLTIILTILLASCNSQSKIDKLGQEGMQLFEQGDAFGALSKFEEIIKIDDKIAEAHLRKADCLDYLADYRSSIKSYSRAIELEPTNKIAIYNRALTYEKLGQFENVEDDYKLAIDTDPSNSTDPDNKLIYHNLGILYGQLNNLDNAIEAFSNAIKIDQTYADAYHNRGYAFQLQGKHEQAIENFDAAINLKPNDLDYQASKKRSQQMMKN